MFSGSSCSDDGTVGTVCPTVSVSAVLALEIACVVLWGIFDRIRGMRFSVDGDEGGLDGYVSGDIVKGIRPNWKCTLRKSHECPWPQS